MRPDVDRLTTAQISAALETIPAEIEAKDAELSKHLADYQCAEDRDRSGHSARLLAVEMRIAAGKLKVQSLTAALSRSPRIEVRAGEEIKRVGRAEAEMRACVAERDALAAAHVESARRALAAAHAHGRRLLGELQALGAWREQAQTVIDLPRIDQSKRDRMIAP